jgi:hypothetical protein
MNKFLHTQFPNPKLSRHSSLITRHSSLPSARVAELVDALDLKSSGLQCPCGFKSRPGYSKSPLTEIYEGLFTFYVFHCSCQDLYLTLVGHLE